MNDKIKEARHKVATASVDCAGTAVLACWCLIGYLDPGMVPDIPGFQGLAAFVLGFSAILMPYGLYRAVRDYNDARRDAA